MVKVAVVPRSMPAGEILEIFGGMIGSSATAIPTAKNMARNRILGFMLILAVLSEPSVVEVRRPSSGHALPCSSQRHTNSDCR